MSFFQFNFFNLNFSISIHPTLKVTAVASIKKQLSSQSSAQMQLLDAAAKKLNAVEQTKMLESVEQTKKLESNGTEKLDSARATDNLEKLKMDKKSIDESASAQPKDSTLIQEIPEQDNSMQNKTKQEGDEQDVAMQDKSKQEGDVQDKSMQEGYEQKNSVQNETAHPSSELQQPTETAQKQVNDPWQDEEDWGRPRTHDPKLQQLAAKAADNQFAQRKILLVLPLFMLVLMLFSAGYGMMQGAFLLKELKTVSDPERIQQITEQLLSMSGIFSSMQAVGCAVWYGLSSLAGSLSLVIPVAVYYRICQRNLHSKTAGLAIFDLIKAEVLKYGLLIVMLGCFFKYTTLLGSVMMLSFAVLIVLEIGMRVWYMPKPNAELQQYLQQSKGKVK